jgi:protein transport protein SEC24
MAQNQDDALAQGVQNLALGGAPTVHKTAGKRNNRKAHHAFHTFTSQPDLAANAYHDQNIDPNEAASAIGLFAPQFAASTSDVNFQTQTPPLNSFNSFPIGASANPHVPQVPQVPHTPNAPREEQPLHQSFDAYNINQETTVDDLSLPSLRNQMNQNYKDKAFLSFQNIVPPIAGTNYKSIDEANSTPQYSRMTMYSVPYSEELREQSKIPLAMCLRPFAECVPSDEVSMEVPQVKIEEGSVVPRCRRCRAYLNPGMQHDNDKMKCNICGVTSPVPIEYASVMSVNGVRDDYNVRPELHTGVVDYIVPSEYNLNEGKPSNPLHRVFLIDLSHSSYQLKVVETLCSAIRVALYNDDGSSRLPKGTLISIIGFDNNLHFFNLSPDLEQTTVSIVTDLDDPFLPFNAGMFVDPAESYNIIDSTLITIEQNNKALAPEAAFGSAMKAAGILLKEVGGGQIISVLSSLPSIGAGILYVKSNNGKQKNDYLKEIFTPDNKYYQELTDDFVRNNIGVNLFVASNANVDLINLGAFAINTGGTVKQWLPFNFERDDITFIFEIKKALDNIAGYQCQLKVRCSHGLQVNKYYGPFKTALGDAAPNIPVVSGDTSIVCDFVYDSKLDASKDAHFQAALLYTSKDGVRKVRVINSILSITQRIAYVFNFSDQDAIAKILLKRTAESFKSTSPVVLKNSLLMRCSEILAAYKHHVVGNNALPTQLVILESLKALPMMILAIMKTKAFREKVQFPDQGVESLFKLSQFNLTKLSAYLYPTLYCIHTLEEGEFIMNEETGMMDPGVTIPLSMKNLTFGGAFLIFNTDRIIIWIHTDVNVLLLKDLFGPHIESLEDLTSNISALPRLDTYISEQVRNMCSYLSKHYNGTENMNIELCRFRMDPNEFELQQLFVEDKSDDLIWSYPEFLKEVHRNTDTKSNALNILNEPVKAADNEGDSISRRFGIF